MNFWSDKNVFLTGANGFIGSWLTKALVEAGANVVCIIRDSVKQSNLDLLGIRDRVSTVQGSVEDYLLIQRILNEYEIETCFHLAAQTIVGSANRSPLSTFESNIRGTWTILESCRQSKLIERLVVASSDKAYGDHPTLPYTEDFPLNGLYPYDASKVCADVLTRCFCYTYNLPAAITRCANVYGGGDLNFSRIIPGTIRSVLRGENPIIRSDGTPVRDYIYISDVVRGYLLLAQHISTGMATGQAFNFGTNRPISVLDLVNLILRLSGCDSLAPRIMLKTKIEGEIDRQFLSSEKAEKMLGWTPEVSLEEGLSKTIDWYRQYFASLREH
ncbi:GDP-mannose 4,6-dehydratase [Candidatus Hakubella thermalkaliphila]|uniref:CDP-glucose 4,6-dehydratase n=1 Tax=Candidatus Hakubella thermalkaliphila TaxID=2754717 RepID=A0A6V8P8X5_9ACTN|nr:GDP-mannose 4,6-dehydratase [Candidatus Hakubella thermalkaliphila]GFP28134.1 CDP-glucose 4,6-dehydratase [Candidatus Hakubella thermalkaliphila]GFP42708.1 CDP-glucose 4,6-dehydratase [Candidatus Hakubella thermalkaliphila]